MQNKYGDISPENQACLLPAIRYVKDRNWHVFPAPPGEKKSYKAAQHSNGARWGATNNPLQVRSDFARWPYAGVGVPTGPENGFWVLECDTPEGHDVDGLAALQALAAEHGALPPTLMAESPSGSVHRYFKWPSDGSLPIKNSASEIAPGVDVKGDGGMVLAPPTLRPGKGVYRWLNDLPIAEAPAWLLELVPRKGESEPYEGSETEADPELVAAAVARLSNPDHDWETWNTTGMAIYASTGGSEEGFALFDTYSKKSSKYNASATREKWGKYHGCPPNAIGFDYLLARAEEEDPDFDTAPLPDLSARLPVVESPATAPTAGGAIPEFSTDWCDVTKVPRRRWLYGQHYIRKHLTATIAPGGRGKSTLVIIEGICIATGKPLLSITVDEPCKVWLWNGEEPYDELKRRVHAVCAHYGLDPYEVAKTFHFTSGLDQFPIKIVTATGKRGGLIVNQKLIAEISTYIRQHDIGVMIVDPFISCHAVPENDNNAIDTVAKTLARMASETGSNVEVAHHTRKAARGDNGATEASDARGADALIAAVRCTRVLNAMSEKEAELFDGLNHANYFRVNRAKVNMTPGSGEAAWYEMVSVEIGNRDDTYPFGDTVQTIASWTPPEELEAIVSTEHIHAVRAKLAAGEYKRNWQSRDAWVGNIIAAELGLDPEGDRAKIERIIKAWIDLKILKIETRRDSRQGRDIPYVAPGEWTEEGSSLT
jgi:hypothetical protein